MKREIKPLTLLVVEDSLEYSKALTTALRKPPHNYRVLSVSDGKSALTTLKQATINCVLADFNLPDMNALTFLGKMREPEFPKIPVIVVTGSESDEIAAKLIKEGAQDYLVKGDFNISLLLRSIRYAMQRHELLTTLNSINTQLKHKSELLEAQRDNIEQKAKSLSEASQYRSSFLRQISHDLRGPLNSLMTFAHSLLDDVQTFSEPQKKCIEMINDSAQALLASVENIELCAKGIPNNVKTSHAQ